LASDELQDDSIDVRAVDATDSLIKCAIRNDSSPEVFKMLLGDERIDPHSEKIRNWPHLYFIQQNNQEIFRLFLDCERYKFQTPNNYIIKIINNGKIVNGKIVNGKIDKNVSTSLRITLV
jgi:hypothetical protein